MQTHPKHTHQLIVSSPDILGGTPVFAGTRVPIKNLTDYLEAGDTLGEFLEDFPSVSREQAVTILERAGLIFGFGSRQFDAVSP